MYCHGDIIEINKDYRLKVELDDTTENPLEWGWDCTIEELDSDEISRWGVSGPNDDTVNMARELNWMLRERRLTEEQRDRAIHLYQVYTGDTRAFEIHKWHGYSQSDWATVIVLWDPEVAGNLYETWAAWRRGDVYQVIEEVRKVYVNKNDPEDTYEDWFEGDSIGGCYLDAGYTPEDVAREHFESFPDTKED